MEKMFYQKPESKEIELLLKKRILVGSDVDEETGEAPFDPDGKD